MKSIITYINESQDDIKIYVDGILVSPDDKILILRRANYMKKFGGKWGFIGGSIDDKDKDSKAAIKREIKEETGYELTWNEEHEMKMFDKINHQDNSSTEYWITKLEVEPEIKISREHSKYEWYEIENDKDYKWMPDVYQIIQKYYND
jgi:8-oxo-dGTP pyrophosphatase MutT (NUDIX family)